MKLLITLFLVFFSITFLTSQPSIQWQKCLGGSQDDAAYSIQQTTDGGYIVAGNTNSNDSDVTGYHGGLTDYWAVKITPSGVIQWQKCLGGSSDDEGLSIQQTIDSGFIVAGYTASNDGDVSGNHGSYDYWVVKLTSVGAIQWQKCLGGSGSEQAYSIQQTTDSGYIVAGYTSSNDSDVTGNHGGVDMWVVKLSSVGTIQWQRCLGGSDNESARSIEQTSDGGYIVAGITTSNDSDVTGNQGSNDYWVIKLTSVGAIQWQKCLGGSGNDVGLSIQQTIDSGYIVAGYTNSNDSDVSGNHGSYDYWVVKLTSVRAIQWQKCIGGSSGDIAYSIQQTTDSGYIVAGYTTSNDDDVSGNHGSYDYWVVNLTPAGGIQWQKCLGGSSDDGAYSIQHTTDGGYIVAGWTNSNDSDVTGNHGSYDCWLVKLSSVVGIEEINNPISQFYIFPNPINQSTTISFSLSEKENTTLIIYDITGREVKLLQHSNLEPGEYSIPWDLTDNKNKRVVDGIYLLTLSTVKEKLTKRIVVIK